MSSRTTMLLDAVVLIKFVVVFGALWRAAVSANGGNIAGYSFADLVWYIVAAEAVVASVTSRFIEEFGDEIGRGDIAVEMVRPVSLLGVRFARMYGESAVRAGAGVLGAAGVAALISGRWPGAQDLVLGTISIAVGLALYVMLNFAFAGIAFWMSDAKAGWFVFQKMTFLFGGLFIPLELLPDGLAAVARWIPFASAAWVPGRMLSGHGSLGLLGLQLGWLAIFAGLTMRMYERGQRRVQVGG